MKSVIKVHIVCFPLSLDRSFGDFCELMRYRKGSKDYLVSQVLLPAQSLGTFTEPVIYSSADVRLIYF